MNKFLKVLNNFNELVMFKHTIFSLPFIFIAMLIAADGWFGWKLFFLGLLAATTARNFAMGINRLLDRDIDRLNPRTASRPSVDGRISSNSVAIFSILNALGFIATAYFINNLAFWLSFPILIILGAYTLFKRFSHFAHIILGISLGLAPIAGVVAVSETITVWSIYLSVGVVFWVAGFDLLYSLQDMEFDKAHALHSIPSKYGADATLKISQLFHTLTILFWLLFAYNLGGDLILLLAVSLSALMLFIEHRIVLKDFKKIDKAFFTINGYLGILFLLLVIVYVNFGGY